MHSLSRINKKLASRQIRAVQEIIEIGDTGQDGLRLLLPEFAVHQIDCRSDPGESLAGTRFVGNGKRCFCISHCSPSIALVSSAQVACD
jgi:hypothetical protein